ncbi:MAG TPA: SDR family oxidoreductase [Verrucomicrobia bacterium]|nr:SDR family oxidoreductase [Verrucomicrobiota bacterium]HOB32413.1 SDR family oxidoreductase [Verrucomicrobiota bacterium]HOP97742.1 SDR family oxidoreductase [Verrucomicrobiota bacterium]
MRVLVVGCGYVGLPLAAELARHGHDVSGLRRTAEADKQMRDAGVTPLHADITRPGDLSRQPADFDWVVNCAATGGGGADEYRRTYVEGTRNLIQWLGSRPQKYVYTSSTSVYAQNDGSLVDEESPAEPVAETARILRETEELLIEATQGRGFPAVILRVAGIYGPGRGYWLKQVLSGEARIEGAGERYVNMVHRDDVAGAIVAALERGVPGRIYNVVDGEPVTQRCLLKWLAQRFGKPVPPVSTEPVSARRGVTSKRVSNRRLVTELQYRFRYPSYREGYG